MTRRIISAEAASDLRDIGDFIAKDNIDAAIGFVERLEQRITELLPFPGIGRKRDEIKPGYRSVAEGEYVIFFRMRNDDVLDVLRIVHAKRDLRKIAFPA